MLPRIDGPAPLPAVAAEGVGVSETHRETPTAPTANATTAAPAQQQAPSTAQVRAAVASANQAIQAFTAALEFEVDPDTDKIVVKLIDVEDRHVLRQVPSEEMMQIARALQRMQTQLVRNKA